MLYCFCHSGCTELHCPDPLALWLPGSFSQREALEADEEQKKGKASIFRPLSLCFLWHLGQWLRLPLAQLHQESPLGFCVLSGNPDLQAPGKLEVSYSC